MERELKEFLTTIDVAIVGLANCGSCTGWTVRDAITAANAGLPTTAIATANFESFAHEIAARGGRSGLRVHVLPYPLNERLRDDVTAIGEAHFNSLLDTMGAQPLREGQRRMTIELDQARRSSRRTGAQAADQPRLRPGGLRSRLAGQPSPRGRPRRRLLHRFRPRDGLGRRAAAGAADRRPGSRLPGEERPLSGRSDRLPAADAIECTVEKIVINAVMAGAPPGSLELLIAAVTSIADPDFELYGVNTTTAPVYPAFVVNGPVRDELGDSLQLWLPGRRGDARPRRSGGRSG